MAKKKANLGTEFQEVPFETKKEIILAIANPDMSIDDIIKDSFEENYENRLLILKPEALSEDSPTRTIW